MNASETLLAKAKSVYESASSLYCARMLVCGQLLHDFILAHLNNGNGMSEADRIKDGYTRDNALEMAATAFEASRTEIKILLRTAMAAHLLSGGNCGSLAHSNIARFARLIKRKTVGVDNSHFGRDGDYQISDSEEWIIKPGIEEKAKGLFARAVAGKWDQGKCESEAKRLYSECDGAKPVHRGAGKLPSTAQSKYRSFSDDEDDEPGGLEINPAVASPGDVADYCLGLVRKSDDPWAVAQRLLVELAKIPKPRMRMVS